MRPPHLSVSAIALLGAVSAKAADRNFAVPAFDRVESSVPFDVRVHTGKAPGVHASGPQEALDRLDVAVRGGTLRIATLRMRSGFTWSGRRERVLIDVGVPMIQAATLSGPGNLAIDRVAAPRFVAALSGPGDLSIGTSDTRELTATLSGPGDLTVAGRTEKLALSLSGPGDLHAGHLTAREATLLLSGPGDITANVTGTVHGTLSGPGDITVTGGARCDITKHGPGDVRCS